MKLIRFKKNVMTKGPDLLPDVKVNLKDYFIKKITYDDIVNYDWLKRWRGQFIRMLNNGDVGFIVLEKRTDKCVGYAWISINKGKMGHFKVLPDNFAWFHNDRVKEEYRGQGLAKALYKVRVDFIQKNYGGYSIYSDTSHSNIPVLKIYESLNFKKVGIYYYISIGTPRIPYGYVNIGKYVRTNTDESS